MKKSRLPQLLCVGLLTVALIACKKEVVIKPNSPNVEGTASTTTGEKINNDLPSSVQDFITQQYPNTSILKYEVKQAPIVGNRYEIKMNNGAELKFDKDGNWVEIKDKQGLNPNLLPASIVSYLNTHYKGVDVESIDKESDKIKVELVNDIDLEFDKNGNFLRVD